jgi:hypothetical protein
MDIPLKIKGIISYIPMRQPTNHEATHSSQIDMTSGMSWDPHTPKTLLMWSNWPSGRRLRCNTHGSLLGTKQRSILTWSKQVTFVNIAALLPAALLTTTCFTHGSSRSQQPYRLGRRGQYTRKRQNPELFWGEDTFLLQMSQQLYNWYKR